MILFDFSLEALPRALISCMLSTSIRSLVSDNKITSSPEIIPRVTKMTNGRGAHRPFMEAPMNGAAKPKIFPVMYGIASDAWQTGVGNNLVVYTKMTANAMVITAFPIKAKVVTLAS